MLVGGLTHYILKLYFSIFPINKQLEGGERTSFEAEAQTTSQLHLKEAEQLPGNREPGAVATCCVCLRKGSHKASQMSQINTKTNYKHSDGSPNTLKWQELSNPLVYLYLGLR